MQRKVNSIFTLLLVPLLLSLLSAKVLAIPSVSAKHAVLLNGEDGEILWEKDADVRAPMASTTKIITALAVMNALPRETVVCVPKEACGVEGSSAYLREGELLTVKDLLYALLLQSANDAAVALALACDGSVEAFCERMNRMVRELGFTQTHLTNPHGLPDGEHYTTAKELAAITAYAMHLPAFAEIVSTKSYTCRTSLLCRTFVNHNKLLSMSEDAVGVKTGFTKKSGRCLVGAARRDGALLITVTLNAPDDWRDHRTLWAYGFAQLGVS